VVVRVTGDGRRTRQSRDSATGFLRRLSLVSVCVNRTVCWRPVYDIEQETEQLKIESRASENLLLASENLLLASEKRLLESEKRLKLLQESNARIARFEQELFSSSTQAPSTGDSSPT
jgi:hypothetical protein